MNFKFPNRCKINTPAASAGIPLSFLASDTELRNTFKFGFKLKTSFFFEFNSQLKKNPDAQENFLFQTPSHWSIDVADSQPQDNFTQLSLLWRATQNKPPDSQVPAKQTKHEGLKWHSYHKKRKKKKCKSSIKLYLLSTHRHSSLPSFGSLILQNFRHMLEAR